MSELSNEELVELIREGHSEYAGILIEQNMGMIRNLAKKYRHISLDQEDIVSICRLQMWRAVLDYDCTQGSKFISFATTYMERGLNREIVKEKSQKRSAEVISADIEYVDDGKVYTLLDILADENCLHDYSDAEMKLCIEEVRKKFGKTATENETKVFELCVMQGFRRSEVARMIGKSRQYVDQVYKRIIPRIMELIDLNDLYESA